MGITALTYGDSADVYNDMETVLHRHVVLHVLEIMLLDNLGTCFSFINVVVCGFSYGNCC